MTYFLFILDRDPVDVVVTLGNKEEVDARSVFVGNVSRSSSYISLFLL